MYPAMNRSPKELISLNLHFLLELYNRSRRDVCEDLRLSYTTFCDWYNGKTYPRIENLEAIAYYFRIEARDFFIEIEKNDLLVGRLSVYAESLGVRLRDSDNPHFTVEDYNETPEGYPVELICGRFFIMESPNIKHQTIVMELSAEIRNTIRQRGGKCRVFPGPFDVELPTKEASVVVPDITIICDSSKLTFKRCVGAPDWIVEVLSERTAKKDQKEKLAAYEEAGVREYWIIDQFHDSITVYSLSEAGGVNTYGIPAIYAFTDPVPVGIYEDFSICLAELDIDLEISE